jgi:hypothetical protein
MNSTSFVWLYLWIAPHVLLAAVVGVMMWNRRYRASPIFFGYLLFEMLQFCVLFGMSRLEPVPWSTYQQMYLLGRAGSIAFRFAIIQEMLEASVAHCASLRRTTARFLRCAAALLAVLAAVFIGSVYSWSIREMVFPVYAINHTLDIVQCGLLTLVFVWHRFLGLRMGPLVVGIALGMGLVAGLEPLMDALKDFRIMDAQVVDLLQMGTYHVSVVVWLYFASVRQQKEVRSDSEVASLLDARKWAVELGRLMSL